MKGRLYYLSEFMSRSCALLHPPHADPLIMQTGSIEVGRKPYENHTVYLWQYNTVHYELYGVVWPQRIEFARRSVHFKMAIIG